MSIEAQDESTKSTHRPQRPILHPLLYLKIEVIVTRPRVPIPHIHRTLDKMYITALPKIPPLRRPVQRKLPQPVRQPIRRIAQLVRNRLLVRVRDRKVGHVLVGDVGDVRVGGLWGLVRGFFEAAGVFGEAQGGFL